MQLLWYCAAFSGISDTLPDASRKAGFALVLSGGGARGLSQIGVLKALDEADLRPDLIVGTSMGAVIGSLYAAGYSPDSIRSIVMSVNWNDIYTNSARRNKLFVSQKNEPIDYLFEVRLNDRLEPIPPNSISHGQAFYDLLGPLLAPAQYRAKSDFDRLPIRLRIVTTDLLSGKRVVLSSGNLAEAVRASSSIPLAFSPVARDGMLLLDGGITANIPVTVAHEENASLIVAIDVTSPLWERSHLDNPVNLMDQVVSISGKSQKETDKRQADLLITPALAGFNNSDFSHGAALIERGYATMRNSLDTLKKLLRQRPGRRDSFTASERAVPGTPEPVTITGIAVSGNPKTSQGLVLTAAGIKTGEPFTGMLHQKALTSLYATNLFNNVNIDLDTTGRVRIMLNEKKYWRVRIGLRFDEFHLGEGFIQPAYENLFGRGILAQIHLQYGLRREKYALEFQNNHLLSANFANNAKLQTYLSTERIFTDTTVIAMVNDLPDTTIWHKEKNLRKSGVLGLVGIQLGRSVMLSSGMHLEFYKVQAGMTSALQDVLGLKFLPVALLRLTMDTMDKFPFPTSGINNILSISGTNRIIGGSANFFKIDGSAKRVVTFWKWHTISPQIRFTWASSPLPEVEQVYMGGSFSDLAHQEMEIFSYVPFIGLKPRTIAGDVMGLIQGRYNYRVARDTYLTAGIDWGYTWGRNYFTWKDIMEDFRHKAPVGVGVGCAFQTLIGPIRFNYGKLLRGFDRIDILSSDLFYFSIGHDF